MSAGVAGIAVRNEKPGGRLLPSRSRATGLKGAGRRRRAGA